MTAIEEFLISNSICVAEHDYLVTPYTAQRIAQHFELEELEADDMMVLTTETGEEITLALGTVH